MNPKSIFSSTILNWNKKQNQRQMPWKGEKDPYKIWLSEIILQQTRVEQGLGYFHKFIQQYPTIHELVLAPEKEIFKLWAGLGYYSRCRNLIHTAKHISSNLNGKFPGDFHSISKLKGVGPYTAAAIASFAYGLPYAVVDGNVYRVIARYFGISTPIDSTGGKKLFSLLAQELLDKKSPGFYNQAIMDLGATVCKPRSPICSACPFEKDCEARLHGFIHKLPVKGKKLVKKERFLNYVIAEYRGRFYIRERKEKDIWKDLHEFILMESIAELPASSHLLKRKISRLLEDSGFTIKSISDSCSQQLTHQSIRGKFITIQLHRPLSRESGYFPVSAAGLKKIAFPKFILNYLESASQLPKKKNRNVAKR